MSFRVAVNKTFLFIVDVADLVCGIVLLSLGMYVWNKEGVETQSPSWLFSVILGGVLVFCSLLSFMSSCNNWRAALFITAWMGLPLAIADVFVAIMLLSFSEKIDSHLTSKINAYKAISVIILCVLALMEILRFNLSRNLRSAIQENRFRDSVMKDLMEKDEREEREFKEKLIKDRYEERKSEFRAKYGRP